MFKSGESLQKNSEARRDNNILRNLESLLMHHSENPSQIVPVKHVQQQPSEETVGNPYGLETQAHSRRNSMAGEKIQFQRGKTASYENVAMTRDNSNLTLTTNTLGEAHLINVKNKGQQHRHSKSNAPCSGSEAGRLTKLN